jgi:hypothetical protein
MKFLRRPECSAWLDGQNWPDSPYGKPHPATTSYLQFAVPKRHGATLQIVDAIRACLQATQDCLFQVTDWSRFVPDLENPVLNSLEATCSGQLPQFDAVGVLFVAGETNVMLECCKVVLDCGMSAYLYVPHVATFYLWEGDLIDFWSDDVRQIETIEAWLTREQINVTSRHTG